MTGNESLTNMVIKSNSLIQNNTQQVRSGPYKSYSKGCIVWYRSSNLVVRNYRFINKGYREYFIPISLFQV